MSTNNVSIFELGRTNAVIRFKKLIEDAEGYAEAGMMARITSVKDEGEIVRVNVSYAEFEDVNQKFESANYWGPGPNSVANLTARQAGQYSVEDHYYIDRGVDLSEYFEVVESNAVLDAFMARKNKEIGYLQWLEQMAALALKQDDQLFRIAGRARHDDPMPNRLDDIVRIAIGLE